MRNTLARRVVQFSTGNVGVHALRTIIGRPDLELVGVHAASPDKIERDAADLCGLSTPTGVITTSDIEELGRAARGLCRLHLAGRDIVRMRPWRI